VEGLASLFGIRSLAALAPELEGVSVGDLTAVWSKHFKDNHVSWAEGGVVNTPTYGVFGEAGMEAFIPMPSGNIPVVINGGSTQSGANQGDRPLYITVEVAGKEFYADVHQISRVEADYVRVTANKTKGNETRRLYKN